MKILVSGAREGFDQRRLELVLNAYLAIHGENLVIVEGCAPGVDTQAFEWARSNDVPVAHYPAPWGHLNKSAGPWRNRAMVQAYAPDLVLVFHDDLYGRSRGSRDMLEYATQQGITARHIATP